MTPLPWPSHRLAAKRQAHLELQAKGTGLRPLKCLGWQVVQNPDFNLHRITTEIRSTKGKNAEAWHKHFSKMGAADNIMAVTSGFEVELYRPMCLSVSKHYITFCFLSHPES